MESGFDPMYPQQKPRSIGLSSMRDRTALRHIDIISAPAAGTAVKVIASPQHNSGLMKHTQSPSCRASTKPARFYIRKEACKWAASLQQNYLIPF